MILDAPDRVFFVDAHESRLHFVSGFFLLFGILRSFAFCSLPLLAILGTLFRFPHTLVAWSFPAHGRLLRPLQFCPGLFPHFSIAYFSPFYLVAVGW